MLFGIWALGVFGYILVSGTRFWIGIAPVYVLVLLLGIDMFAKSFISPGARQAPQRLARRAFWSAGLMGWAAAVILGVSIHYGPMGYPNVLRAGYGIPCFDGDVEPVAGLNARCSRAVEAQYDALRPLLEEDNVIISTRPFVTSYYLGRPHGWMRQKKSGTRYTAFESSTDPYFGISLIDTRDELVQLAYSPQRAWIITQTRDERAVSANMMALLQQLFRVHGEPGPLTVYVNSAERARLSLAANPSSPSTLPR
jgi:hypothetical protein